MMPAEGREARTARLAGLRFSIWAALALPTHPAMDRAPRADSAATPHKPPTQQLRGRYGWPGARALAARRMRASMNTTELLIGSRLRGRKVDGRKFRRQQPIGPYFVDFYRPAAKLIVEIDGP